MYAYNKFWAEHVDFLAKERSNLVFLSWTFNTYQNFDFAVLKYVDNLQNYVGETGDLIIKVS